MSSFPPGAFIIGAQKCGTTSLAGLLNDNPAICLSEPKEPNYYTVNYDRGMDWYRDCFADTDRLLLDASTTYTMAALSERALALKAGRRRQLGVPQRIQQDSPDARFIYIIRNPVQRLYSNYWHNVKYGYEKDALETAIERDPQYLHMSEYYGQLARYLECFQPTQILVIRFEDFVADQQALVNRCERFLGVPETEVRKSRRENRGAQYTGLGQFLVNNRAVRNADRLLPRRARETLRRMLSRDIPPLPDELAAKLAPLFERDQQRLQDTFGVSYAALS